MKFINNVKSTFASTEVSNDRADLVQTVLLIAGFAVAALILVNWLSSAILNKAADAASCIEGSNSYNNEASAKNCEETSHSDEKSFKDDKAYTDRF